MLYYIERGAKMSIRQSLTGELLYSRSQVSGDTPTVEYHGGNANVMVDFTRFADLPATFEVSLPLFVEEHGLLEFYLSEMWHRYLADHMIMCTIDQDGNCSPKKENIGERKTGCCDFYTYFSYTGSSWKKEELGRDLATTITENMKANGVLSKMKQWHFGQGEFKFDKTSFDSTAFPPTTVGSCRVWPRCALVQAPGSGYLAAKRDSFR
jgi:hypothetical protein